jgi:hypothetical protein
MYGGSSKWINTFPLRTILNTTVSLNITNAHANNLIIFNNGANSLVVIPADTSIPVGFTFDVVRWQTYKVQFYAATDVTIVSEGNKTYINDTYQCVTCTKINTSHGWLLCGALSAT